MAGLKLQTLLKKSVSLVLPKTCCGSSQLRVEPKHVKELKIGTPCTCEGRTTRGWSHGIFRWLPPDIGCRALFVKEFKNNRKMTTLLPPCGNGSQAPRDPQWLCLISNTSIPSKPSSLAHSSLTTPFQVLWYVWHPHVRNLSRPECQSRVPHILPLCRATASIPDAPRPATPTNKSGNSIDRDSPPSTTSSAGVWLAWILLTPNWHCYAGHQIAQIRARQDEEIKEIGAIHDRVDGLQNNVDNLGHSLNNLNNRVEGLQNNVDNLGHSLNNLNNRVEGLQNNMDNLGHSLNNRVEGLQNNMVNLGHSLNNRVSSVENRLAGIEDRMTGVEKNMRAVLDREFFWCLSVYSHIHNVFAASIDESPIGLGEIVARCNFTLCIILCVVNAKIRGE